jgi:hypothetical protein
MVTEAGAECFSCKSRKAKGHQQAQGSWKAEGPSFAGPVGTGFWTCRLEKGETIFHCFKSHVCGALSQWPKEINSTQVLI